MNVNLAQLQILMLTAPTLVALLLVPSLTLDHPALVAQNTVPPAVRAAAATGAFAEEKNCAQFHQGSTCSWKQIAFPDLFRLLKRRGDANPHFPVYIQGQKEATHASMVYVLDLVRRAGIQKVAFSVKLAETTR